MDVVVDPLVPEEDARVLREHTEVLARMRAGWRPRPGSRRVGLAGALVMSMLGFLAVSTLMIFIGLARTGPGLTVLGFVGFVIFTAAFVNQPIDDEDVEDCADREVYERAREHDGRYVLATDLDEPALRALCRARAAVQTVTLSRANAAGLLDGVRNAVVLPAQEWEIARLLAKLSALRVGQERTLAPGVVPEVAAVAEPLTRALESSEAAVVARVAALERYAERVSEVERAYHAHRQVAELRDRLPQYEELVAEAGAGTSAELDRLADDAGELESALRRSLNSAHAAFRYLEPGS